MFYSSEAGFFDDKKASLLKELSCDMSYAVEKIENHEKHNKLEKDRNLIFNFSVDLLSIIGFDGFHGTVSRSLRRK